MNNGLREKIEENRRNEERACSIGFLKSIHYEFSLRLESEFSYQYRDNYKRADSYVSVGEFHSIADKCCERLISDFGDIREVREAHENFKNAIIAMMVDWVIYKYSRGQKYV